jgi:hypothetical protein
MDKAALISWILFSIRNVLGYEHNRNTILATELKRIPGLEFGRTFSEEYKNEDLLYYLSQIIKVKNKRILFTAANLPDLETQETHYQTYVVNTKTKLVLMMDPARKASGKGIYPAIVSREIIRPFFESNGYTVSWIDTSSACQIKMQDVFCQSWSLYLQIQAILYPETRIDIPKTQAGKYGILLNFFKRVINYDTICEELQKEYIDTVKNAPTKDLSVSEKKYLIKQDPCSILAGMETKDMFDDDEDKPNTNHPLAVTLRERKPT